MKAQRNVEELVDEKSFIKPKEALEDAIERLAKTSGSTYFNERKAIAKEHNIKLGEVDVRVKEVKKTIKEQEDNCEIEKLFLPTDIWNNEVNGNLLYEEIYQLFATYHVCSEEAKVIASLYIILTYFVEDIKSTLPNLMVTAPEKECGKSLFLEIIGLTCNKGLTTGTSTPAFIKRVIEHHRPTLLFDEADLAMRDPVKRAITNAGFTRQMAQAGMCVGESQTPKTFDLFCPKIFAGISLEREHETMVSRCHVIELQRKLPHETCKRIDKHIDEQKEFKTIRDKCKRFYIDNQGTFNSSRPLIPGQLQNRQFDIWEPLITIAELCNVGEKAREVAIKKSIKESSKSTKTTLLENIYELFEEHKWHSISSDNLTQQLTGNPDWIWDTYSNGYPIKQKKVTSLIKEFGISSEKIFDSYGKRVNGFKVEQFNNIFERYIPKEVQIKIKNDLKNKNISHPEILQNIGQSDKPNKYMGSSPKIESDRIGQNRTVGQNSHLLSNSVRTPETTLDSLKPNQYEDLEVMCPIVQSTYPPVKKNINFFDEVENDDDNS